MNTIEKIRKDVIGLVLEILQIAPDELNTRDSLSRFGVDSVKAVWLKTKIEDDYGVVIPYELLISGPSIDTISDHIFQSANSPASIDTDDEIFTF